MFGFWLLAFGLWSLAFARIWFCPKSSKDQSPKTKDLQSQISNLKSYYRIRSTFNVHRIDEPDVPRLASHNQ